MARGIVLDSSVVIPHLRGNFDIRAHVSLDDVCFIPLPVLGELHKGVLKAAHPAENRLLLTKFLRTTELLLPGVATAVRYSEISHALALKGTPIPENDIWIAAAATEFGMPLVTRDAHFKNVAGLEMLAW